MSIKVFIRFYEELNDFLPKSRHKQEFEVSFNGDRSVKDLIESLGVPHVEVDLILVNGTSVGFEYLVRDGDRISVYPVFESLDISSFTRLRPTPLRETRFVLDVHLQRLARYLRLLGFDVLFNASFDDAMLAEISAREKRILLTRDRGLLMRKIVQRGFIVRNTDPKKQLVEVLHRLNLYSSCRPFSRCLKCNGAIEQLQNNILHEQIPEGVRAWCRKFYRCTECGKVYWKGSHYEKLQAFVKEIMEDENAKNEKAQ